MEVTTSGKPEKITKEWFRTRYGQNFPDLLAEDKNDILNLNLWEGDRIFLKLLCQDSSFFSLKLCYEGDNLVSAELDGQDYIK